MLTLPETTFGERVSRENVATIDLSKEVLNRETLRTIQQLDFADQQNKEFASLTFSFAKAVHAQELQAAA